MEILRVVLPWDAGWGTNPQINILQPFRIGVYCVKGRHRSFAKTLLAAAALEHMGFKVYTEAPCTDPCGCGTAAGLCLELTGRLRGPERKAVVYQHAMQARLAKQIAIGTSAITLAIILRSRWWCDDKKGSVAHM